MSWTRSGVIAEGEVLQLMNMHDPDLAVGEYLRVIRYKTAKLFEASARLGAVLGGAKPAHPKPAPRRKTSAYSNGFCCRR